MVVQYSKTTSLSVALENTFDGMHPCKLCKLVQDGKKAERNQDVRQGPVKFELCTHVDGEPRLYPPDVARVIVHPVDRFQFRSDRPPTPPPRLA